MVVQKQQQQQQLDTSKNGRSDVPNISCRTSCPTIVPVGGRGTDPSARLDDPHSTSSAAPASSVRAPPAPAAPIGPAAWQPCNPCKASKPSAARRFSAPRMPPPPPRYPLPVAQPSTATARPPNGVPPLLPNLVRALFLRGPRPRAWCCRA